MTTPKTTGPLTADPLIATALPPTSRPVDLPWVEGLADSPAAAAIALSSRPIMRRNRPSPAFEAVHWSVAVLTLATALSLLAGSYRGENSQPRELLPIMMTAYR